MGPLAALPLLMCLGAGCMVYALVLHLRQGAADRRRRILERYAAAGLPRPQTSKAGRTTADSTPIPPPREGPGSAATARAAGGGLRHRRPALRFLSQLNGGTGLVRWQDLREVPRLLKRRDALLLLCGGTAIAVTLAVVIDLPVGVTALAGAGLGLAIFRILHHVRRQRELTTIAEDVPDALESIVRALRVGSPINKALAMVAEAGDGPISREFGETAHAISYGQDVVTALHDLAARCANHDLLFLATAVAIQNNSGGNLAQVIERLSRICRSRQQLDRKVSAITSEAKWSGNFLSVFPGLAGLCLLMLNPNYFDEVYGTPIFLPMITLVGALLLANLVFMRRLVRLKH
ncbi:type II secretion system F family protein [Pseudooceanicola aestuarii]|uniref:type II secretion system F family protein n=1 Tax=Pseudooceanicola aestuarii TaxID=2697319 RepID=UPI0013D006AB|nr:type II secretion system F family protein [Pseudooceanicola aestuarii]